MPLFTLIRDGGFPMWFILLFGAIAVYASARHALQPDPRRLQAIRGFSLATLWSTVSGTAAALGTTLHTLAGARGPQFHLQNPDGPIMLLTGLAESMSALIVGGALLCLVGLFTGVAALRAKEALPAA